MRLEIHVRPNASRTAVGGSYGGALVVRVSSPAEGGKATRSALAVIADAFGVPRHSVTLAHGSTSRRKLVDIQTGVIDEDTLAERLRQLPSRFDSQGTNAGATGRSGPGSFQSSCCQDFHCSRSRKGLPSSFGVAT